MITAASNGANLAEFMAVALFSCVEGSRFVDLDTQD